MLAEVEEDVLGLDGLNIERVATEHSDADALPVTPELSVISRLLNVDIDAETEVDRDADADAIGDANIDVDTGVDVNSEVVAEADALLLMTLGPMDLSADASADSSGKASSSTSCDGRIVRFITSGSSDVISSPIDGFALSKLLLCQVQHAPTPSHCHHQELVMLPSLSLRFRC